MKQEQSKLLLIDGHSILNRAFFGLPDLTNAAGLHTNAVYGFLNIMFKFIDAEKPTHLTVAFDEHAPTFRHEIFADYKGTRKPMADELRQQVPMMRQMLEAMGVTVISQPGLEADDLLGTMAAMAESQGFEVTIVSGDRDLLQLATDHTKISIPKTKRTGTEIENYFAADVKEKYLVTPTEFIDVKALWGDTADNIPGVPSIGEKTATALIAEYHSIEEAYAHVEEIKPPRASKNLAEFYEQAQLSKVLATINNHADISYDLASAELSDFYTPEAYELCKEWEFKNFLPRFSVKKDQEEIRLSVTRASSKSDVTAFIDAAIAAKATTVGGYLWFDKEAGADADGQLSLFEEPKAAQSIRALVLSHKEQILYVSATEEMDDDFLLEQIKRLLSSGVILAVKGLKDWIKHLAAESQGRMFTYSNSYDVEVAEYLLHPLKSEYPTEDLAAEFADMTIPTYSERFGKKKLPEVQATDFDSFVDYVAMEAYIYQKSYESLEKALEDEGMHELYHHVELPLVFTLADMELAGIAMNGEALSAYGERLAGRIAELEQEIYEAAGEEFNINSPKQLGVILFERLELPGAKKTKTGYSTAAEVLEALADEHPIVASILEYRQLAKLKSTYADGLVQALAEDGRVHSTFQQTVTATGRISSTEPNLQNIPIRMEMGKEIRRVFYPKEGFVFVDADYSQIELRVLSHMSGDDNLIQAFLNGQDIHRSTAALVFHTPFDEVTELQRRNAKAVNFGIVYGISAFGLGKDLGIDRKEAQRYIDDYFAAYPKMKIFLDELVAAGKEKGSVKSMYGRIRPIPELSSSNFMQKQFGERVAMNSPIQGTAADIIKIAMVRVHDRLAAEGLASRLLLQVHDELLIEAKESELDQVKKLLVEEMEQAASLAVPLEVDMHTGATWYDAK